MWVSNTMEEMRLDIYVFNLFRSTDYNNNNYNNDDYNNNNDYYNYNNYNYNNNHDHDPSCGS